MKIKSSYLVLLLLTGMLYSCQQEEDLFAGADATSPLRELNLQDFSYSDVQSLFSGNKTVGNISFVDGEIVKNVSNLEKNTSFEMLEEDGTPSTTYFYNGAENDSIEVVIGKEYASIRMTVNGKQLGYVSYSNADVLEAAVSDIVENVTTRSVANSLLTRSVSNTSFKMDLSEMAKSAPDAEEYEPIKIEDSSEEPDASPASQTRSAYYTQWPRGNTLTIHLVRDAGNMPWEYELNWQVNDMIASIKDVRSDLNVKVWRSSTGYWASARYDALLSHFKKYCESSSFPYGEASGHDIIVLVRQKSYAGYYLGQAYLNGYKLSRYNNPWAYGIAATTAFYPKTLAHEVGHILGGKHVSARPWWQFWLYDDVMVPVNNSINMGNRHLNSDNRNTIWNNLH